MLYGRRLDQSLEHVDGSRYALVHAVAKRARQITLWLTADPAELRAEAAPPPAPGELISRDPVALAEAEILAGEVLVKWDPDGLDEADEGLPAGDDDPLLIEGVADDDDDGDLDESGSVTPALAQVLDADGPASDVDDLVDADEDELEEDVVDEDGVREVSFEAVAEEEAAEDENDIEE